MPFHEKQRLADQVRAVLLEYLPVQVDPDVATKLRGLLKLHSGVELSDLQFDQVIPLLTRKSGMKRNLVRI